MALVGGAYEGICVQALRCVLCGYVGIVVALVDLGNMLGTVRPRTHSDLIPWAQKIEFESCK